EAGSADAQYGLALAAIRLGDLETARVSLNNALSINVDRDRTAAIAECLETKSMLAYAEGEFDEALSLFAESRLAWGRTQFAPRRSQQQGIREFVQRLETAVGTSMSLSETISFAEEIVTATYI
ncbi:MAG: hypothetical protein AB7V46_01390, partial [Thermomicrobiales bacterium]